MGDHTHSRRIKAVGPGPVHTSEPLGCIKVKYDTEAEADEVGMAFPVRQTPYRCGKCGAWHLTKHRRFRWNDRGRRNR